MRLRLTGTEQECADAVAALAAGWFTVREVSPFYRNRGATVLGRVYVDAEPVPDLAGVTDSSTSAPTADAGPTSPEVWR